MVCPFAQAGTYAIDASQASQTANASTGYAVAVALKENAFTQFQGRKLDIGEDVLVLFITGWPAHFAPLRRTGC